ncbi:PGDYG domain-containing protein [Gimesia sp.]|uniref:PGDYG domain-containing protein n=1 Tax=Gimesia sp. TaxID=2024833 RepID=UPI003A8F9F9B
MSITNQLLLDEVNSAGLWFTARKTRPLWAKEITVALTVPTIEGQMAANVGDYLCRGSAGDIWPQKAETLHKKYSATGEFDNEGWEKFTPRPEGAGVQAARIKHPFTVKASWGDLTGQPGDYLVKSEVDKDVKYPDDIWIVAATIFEETYESLSKEC